MANANQSRIVKVDDTELSVLVWFTKVENGRLVFVDPDYTSTKGDGITAKLSTHYSATATVAIAQVNATDVTGHYWISFTGLSPAFAEDDQPVLRLDGEIDGVAWSQALIPIEVQTASGGGGSGGCLMLTGSNDRDYALESTFDVKFTTRSFSTGIPATLGGTPAVEIYEDNSAIQITSGITLTTDFDSVTGLNNLRIAATAANGFEAGKSYSAVISTGTVGGVSVVGEVICNFSIQRVSAAVEADLDDRLPSAAAKTNIDADYDGTGYNKSNSTIGTATTVADGAKSATALSTATWTSGRAALLDNLDVAISILQTQITNLNNLSAKANIFGPPVLEVPDSGTNVYEFTLVVKDDEDKPVNLDGTPTLTLVNASGTDRSSLLSTVTNPSTGQYRWTATVGTSTAKEGLTLKASGTVSAEERLAVWGMAVMDIDQVTLLNAINNAISTAQADLDILTGSDGVTLATSQPNYAPATAASLTTVASNITTLLGKFTGMTSLTNWLRLLFRSDTAIKTDAATELAEINSDEGSGAGNADNVTDSVEAISDNGGGGGGSLSPSDITAIADAVQAVGDNIPPAVDGVLTGYENATWTQQFTGLLPVTGYDDIVFVLKRREQDPDSKAILKVSKTNGLVKLIGHPSPSSSGASITVDEEAPNAEITLTVSSGAMSYIPPGKYLDGLKKIKANDDVVLRQGITVIRESVVDEVTPGQ